MNEVKEDESFGIKPDQNINYRTLNAPFSSLRMSCTPKKIKGLLTPLKLQFDDLSDNKTRDLVSRHNKEIALLEQKLELTLIELNDLKETYEQHKKYSEKMIMAINNNSHIDSITRQWEIGKQMYMKDLIDTKYQE